MLTNAMPAVTRALQGSLPPAALKQLTQALGNCNLDAPKIQNLKDISCQRIERIILALRSRTPVSLSVYIEQNKVIVF